MARITWQTPNAFSAADVSKIESLINYSTDYINSFLARPISWDVSVKTEASTSGILAQGSANVAFWYNNGSKNIALTDGQMQSITGTEVQGYDSIILINTTNYPSLFFDASPATSNDIPSNLNDAVSVFTHEILHGLAFNGWTNFSSYINTSNTASLFDTNIKSINGLPYFIGENAQIVNGGPVPLMPGNIIHVGNANVVPNAYSNNLMYPTASRGVRYSIDALDLAILADCGLGTIQNDILNGSPLDDNIAAGRGNDIIRASIGNDKIDGGDDLDYVTFSGNASSFSISAASNGTVTVTNSSFGTDTLNNVERVRFTDKVIAFDTTGNAGQAFRMYKAALDRTPDERGLAGWIKFMDDGGALKNMAQQFIDSQEFRTKYGALDNTNFINQLYKNVLARNGEPSGISGWVNGLANGLTRADVLKGFSESGENQTNVAKLIGNGISYTEWWLA